MLTNELFQEAVRAVERDTAAALKAKTYDPEALRDAYFQRRALVLILRKLRSVLETGKLIVRQRRAEEDRRRAEEAATEMER